MNVNTQTNRLILRPAKSQDAKILAEKRSQPFVLKYNLYLPCSEEQILAEIDDYPLVILQKKDDNQLIGAVSIREDSFRYHVNAIELQFWLEEKYSQQGYMTEALEKIICDIFYSTDTEQISIKVFSKNLASLKLAEKLSFDKEGYLKNAVKNSNGKTFDLVLFSLSKNDYLAKHSK